MLRGDAVGTVEVGAGHVLSVIGGQQPGAGGRGWTLICNVPQSTD